MAEVERDWSGEAKGLLKGELKRRNLTYADLVAALAGLGIAESEANLRNKVSRGNFSAAFLLQALTAIGCTVVHLGEPTVQPRISNSLRSKWRASKLKLERDGDDNSD